MTAPTAAAPEPPASRTGEPSLWPTRKWVVAQITALGALAGAWVEAGDFTTTVQIMAIGIAVQAVSTWLIPNAPTPGGVPLKH